MARLAGKVALITGASKGLGEADARLFAREGARVFVADVDRATGEIVASALGGGAEFLQLDVRSETAFKAAIDNVMDRAGRLDILVNNAGLTEPGTPETIKEDEYRLVMAVSVDGTVFGCKHAIPAMAAGGGGSIINIASVATVQGVPFSAAYSAAKGAVEAYTRTVAVHCKVKDLNIRCNSVHPGAFATEMMKYVPEKMKALMDEESFAQLSRRISGRVGDPVDVANLVLFLASDESRYINGQRFVIDNGDSVTPLSAKG